MTTEEEAAAAEAEPACERIGLGALEGLLDEEEATLARRIARVTGYVPLVRQNRDAAGAIIACVVVYQFVPIWDHTQQPEYRTREVAAPENIEGPRKLAHALRTALRTVQLDHRKDV